MLLGGVDVHDIDAIGAIVAATHATELFTTWVCRRDSEAKAHRLLRRRHRHDCVIVLTGKTLATLVVEVARRADMKTVMVGGAGSAVTTGAGDGLPGGIGATPVLICSTI